MKFTVEVELDVALESGDAGEVDDALARDVITRLLAGGCNWMGWPGGRNAIVSFKARVVTVRGGGAPNAPK